MQRLTVFTLILLSVGQTFSQETKAINLECISNPEKCNQKNTDPVVFEKAIRKAVDCDNDVHIKPFFSVLSCRDLKGVEAIEVCGDSNVKKSCRSCVINKAGKEYEVIDDTGSLSFYLGLKMFIQSYNEGDEQNKETLAKKWEYHKKFLKEQFNNSMAQIKVNCEQTKKWDNTQYKGLLEEVNKNSEEIDKLSRSLKGPELPDNVSQTRYDIEFLAGLNQSLLRNRVGYLRIGIDKTPEINAIDTEIQELNSKINKANARYQLGLDNKVVTKKLEIELNDLRQTLEQKRRERLFTVNAGIDVDQPKDIKKVRSCSASGDGQCVIHLCDLDEKVNNLYNKYLNDDNPYSGNITEDAIKEFETLSDGLYQGGNIHFSMREKKPSSEVPNEFSREAISDILPFMPSDMMNKENLPKHSGQYKDHCSARFFTSTSFTNLQESNIEDKMKSLESKIKDLERSIGSKQ